MDRDIKKIVFSTTELTFNFFVIVTCHNMHCALWDKIFKHPEQNIVQNRGNIASRFSSNSEVNASELIENLEETT